ncbi:MAG: hypothetical protein JXB38_21310 [Anaerolineales bacterium]|nr:hypothetical protein [Anaerolineales bacterium]
MKSSRRVGIRARIQLVFLLFAFLLPTLFCTDGNDAVSLPPTPVTPVPFKAVFSVVDGYPTAVSSVDYHPDRGCQFLGIGGRVIDRTCTPKKDYEIQLTGSLDGSPIQMRAISGKAPAYGVGGFEFILAGEPIASSATLAIRIVDHNGMPLSSPVSINTYADCSQNLILVDFWQSEGDSAFVKAVCTATMEALYAQVDETQTQVVGLTLTATAVPIGGQEP